MAEGKRIATTTVGPLKKDRKQKESVPTQRFELPLEPTNNQFNWRALLKSRGLNTDGECETLSDSDDPFQEPKEGNRIHEIARDLEAKYGTGNKPGKKMKKKPIVEDYVDLGLGYDETDPFIDNSEAYDELVPSMLTTQYGGFYINSGRLNFKEIDSDSSDDVILDTAVKKKRRKLKELDRDGKRRKKHLTKGEPPRKRGRKPLHTPDGALGQQSHMQAMKQANKQPTVATLLQQHKALQQVKLTVPPSTFANGSGQSGANALGVSDLKVVNSSVNQVIESVINASRDHDSNDGGMNTGTGSSDSELATFPTDLEQEGEDAVIPDSLPTDLDGLVNLIKEAAALRSEEGKCKFFSGEVNTMLLGIELKSRELPCGQRSSIFAHLATHLPCTKETLMKRAKKLRLDQEGGKLRQFMNRLKEAIDKVMPSLYEKFTKAKQEPNADRDPVNNTESEDEDFDEKSNNEHENPVQNSHLTQKKFEWSNDIRKLVCDVVTIKMKCYEVSKTRSQSADDYLRHFLLTEVKQQWPRGWMRASILYKETKSAHAYLTSKPKKSLGGIYKKPNLICLPTNESLLSKNGLVVTPVVSLTTAVISPTTLGTTILPAHSTSSTPKPTGKSSPVLRPHRIDVSQLTTTLVTTTTTVCVPSSCSLTLTPALSTAAITTTVPAAATFIPAAQHRTSLQTLSDTNATKTIFSTSGTTMSEGFAIRVPMQPVSPSVSVSPLTATLSAKSSDVMYASSAAAPVTVTTTVNSVPVSSVSPRATSLEQSPSKHSVTYPSSGKHYDVSVLTTSANKFLPEKAYSQAAWSDSESITVASLLKQVSAAGVASTLGESTGSSVIAGNASVGPGLASVIPVSSVGTSVTGRMYHKDAYPETDSPQETILTRIIHNSLMNYPNSGNQKSSVEISTLSSVVKNTSNCASPNQKNVSKSCASPIQYNKDTKPNIGRPQISLLKQQPSSHKAENLNVVSSVYSSGKSQDFTRNIMPNCGTTPAKQSSLPRGDLEHNTQVSRTHKPASYSAPQDGHSLSPFSSKFDFGKKMGQLMGQQNKTGGSLSSNSYSGSVQGVGIHPGMTNSASPMDSMKDVEYARSVPSTYKDPSDRRKLKTLHTLSDSGNEQPLNYTTNRSTAAVPQSGLSSPPAGTTSANQTASSALYGSRNSPLHANYHMSPKEGGIKSSVSGTGRVSNLPQPVYRPPVSSSSISRLPDPLYLGNDVLGLAVASTLFGMEGAFSSSSHSPYTASPPIQVSSMSTLSSQQRLPNHTTAPTGLPCSTPSMSNQLSYPKYIYDSNSTQPPEWRSSTTPGPTGPALYQQPHYPNTMLGRVGGVPNFVPTNSKVQHHTTGHDTGPPTPYTHHKPGSSY